MSEKGLSVSEKAVFVVPEVGRLAAGFSDELQGLSFEFDRVHIPSGGGLAFEVPGDDPSHPDVVKEIVGVIVDHHACNAYWEDKFSGGNAAPDCASLDGIVGSGVPGGACVECEMNQWGSDPTGGKGKACKNMRRVYVLRSRDTFPLLLTLPPTSIKNFATFLKRVLMKGLSSREVVARITLAKATNAAGINYSVAQFAVESLVPENGCAALAVFAENIKAITRSVRMEGNDYHIAEEEVI